MNTYIVLLESRDGQGFEFKTKAKDQKTAVDNAFTRLEELDYAKYGHTLKSIIKKND